MDKFGGGHQADALCLRLWQNFAQSLERCRVRVADRDGFAFFACAAQGQLKLFPDGGHFGDIIEERDVSKGGAHAKILRGFVSHSGGSGAAVHVEKLMVAQDWHQFVHKSSVGGGL